MTANKKKEQTVRRGRPRSFEPEMALDEGERLFHAGSYDSVGMATLTETLGIKPPSFYKVFGSKAEFFSQVLKRYANASLVLDPVRHRDRAPLEALTELLESAARLYARHPERRGCLVLETARGQSSEESTRCARRLAEQHRRQIFEFVSHTHPDEAARITDFVSSTMSGLSASAREGMDETRLLDIARTAVMALEKLLSDDS